MNIPCDPLQERIAADGVEEVRAVDSSREHIDGCAACTAVVAALGVIDATIPSLELRDAPDEMVERTLARVRLDAPEVTAAAAEDAQPESSALGTATAPLPWWRKPLSKRALLLTAAAFAIALAVAIPNLFRMLQDREQGRTMSDLRTIGTGVESYEHDPALTTDHSESAGHSGTLVGQVSDSTGGVLPGVAVVVTGPRGDVRTGFTDASGQYRIPGLTQDRYDVNASMQGFETAAANGVAVGGGASRVDLTLASNASEEITVTGSAPIVDVSAASVSSYISVDEVEKLPKGRNFTSSVQLSKKSGNKEAAGKGQVRGPIDRGGQERWAQRASVTQAAMNAQMNMYQIDGADIRPGARDEEEEKAQKKSEERRRRGGRQAEISRRGVVGGELSENAPADQPMSISEIVQPESVQPMQVLDNVADTLLRGRADPAKLQFQSASGYWDNSYVPGDPTIRLLETRLATDAIELETVDGKKLALDDASRQYNQPFDTPRDSALAVYMHADRAGFSGSQRMLVQVGLQGTSRSSGLRPSMNVGVVLDLRGTIPNEIGASMRGLLSALNDAKQTGDRFSVTVAGRPGDMLIPPDEFKHGAIMLALQKLFGGAPPNESTALDLKAALELAASSVARGDNPDAPLGASVVLLVTSSRLGDQIDALEQLAHKTAVGGVPMSVVAAGTGVDLEEIDRLTLAGQGNRRLMMSREDAARLVDLELHSASRVVARAVRLRIRLSPGVKLIEVLRAKRLDAGRSTRVREAEQSIDLRTARSLGITADRGDDEEGIQIVIPSYYAGDSHVILLDVVAERPGSIADITVRYKDLVYLRNGVARANLSLGSRRDAPGPLELNVLKNLVALRMSEAIREAGLGLTQGDRERAQRILAQQESLLIQLRNDVAGWNNDRELQNDLRMVNEYQAALETSEIQAEDLQKLSDSLRYAGHMKVTPRRR